MIQAPIQRTDDHRYLYAGKEFPGVTNVLKVIDKSDALIAWAARNTAEAALELAKSRVHDGPVDTDGLSYLVATVGERGAVKALTERSTWKRDAAAHLGSAVHGYADDLVSGREIPELEGAQKAYVERYAEWWASAGWKVRTSEAIVVHDTHGYGGTLDLLCYDADGRTVLADIKTGASVFREAVLQLTAYGNAELLQTPVGALYTMPKVDRYAIIHVLGDKPTREVPIVVGTRELNAWGAALDLYGWWKTTKGKRL